MKQMICSGLALSRLIAWGGLLLLASTRRGLAQDVASVPASPSAVTEIPLYDGAAPGSENWDWSERSTSGPKGITMAQDVVRPVLLHYPADKQKAVGTAMIVAPGGGFRALMMSYEGSEIAQRLSSMGVEAFVLKYRLLYTGPGAPSSPTGAPAGGGERRPDFTLTGSFKAQTGQNLIALAADDGRQAVRLVRQRADDFGVRPERVGMIGFSAGGMVTSEALFGPAETRPDFAAIIYGVGQIREAPSPAPPLFLAVAADDALAAERTVEQFTAYRHSQGLVELHVFQMGAHGFVNKGGGADHFVDRVEDWLRTNKLLGQAAAAMAAPIVPTGASSVAGKWHAEFDTMVGPMTYDYDFQVAGGKLTGTASGGLSNEKHAPVAIQEGQVQGEEVSFVETLNAMGNEVSVHYTGKVVGNEIHFVRKVGQFATEEFTAQRVPGNNVPAGVDSQRPKPQDPQAEPAPMRPHSDGAQTDPAGPISVTLGDGGSGPYKAVLVGDPALPQHTLYRPADLAPFGKDHKLPVVLWGNGGGMRTSALFRDFLTEIASHGFFIVAIGPANAAVPGGSPPPHGLSKSAELLDGLTWALAQNDESTEYRGKLDVHKIAVMGQSLGGLQALEVAPDARITTTVLWNSGVLNELPEFLSDGGAPKPGFPAINKDALKKLHGPIAYFVGGPSDMATPNAEDDFARIDHVPVFLASRDVGHYPATFQEPHGGAFAVAGVAWLKWQLKGDKEAENMFVGEPGGLAADPAWSVKAKKLK